MNICIVTSKRFEFIQRFYLQKLGFELENENPQACVLNTIMGRRVLPFEHRLNLLKTNH